MSSIDVPRQRDEGDEGSVLAESASRIPLVVTVGGRPPTPPEGDEGSVLAESASQIPPADTVEGPPEALLRQVRARRRLAKARRAAMLRSLALLRSSGYAER